MLTPPSMEQTQSTMWKDLSPRSMSTASLVTPVTMMTAGPGNRHRCPQVNEHSKPGHTGDNDDSGTWQPAPVSPVKSYYEINRSEPIAWVEEVKITESKDYSEPDIIYDVTKEGFDDDKDTFSVPVAEAFNIPATVET